MIILAVMAAIVVVFLLFVGSRPTDFRIERSTAVNAPAGCGVCPGERFPQVAAWSPWEQIDPNMQRTYEGPRSGTGSIYSWSGNKNVGAGRMTLGESHPNSLIRIKLEFFKPFKATNTAEFTFRPEGKQTVVTWAMSGRKNFMMKLVHAVHEHGQDDRHGIREGPGADEIGLRIGQPEIAGRFWLFNSRGRPIPSCGMDHRFCGFPHFEFRIMLYIQD